MATTQFEATDARAAFPCFDEPEFKSQFIVTLVHTKEYNALSNMPVEKVVSRDDGFMESHFKESVKMSTYLLAFIVSDFAYKETRTKSGKKVCMRSRFSIESRETKSKAITMANHNKRKQHNEPINANSKQIYVTGVKRGKITRVIKPWLVLVLHLIC